MSRTAATQREDPQEADRLAAHDTFLGDPRRSFEASETEERQPATRPVGRWILGGAALASLLVASLLLPVARRLSPEQRLRDIVGLQQQSQSPRILHDNSTDVPNFSAAYSGGDMRSRHLYDLVHKRGSSTGNVFDYLAVEVDAAAATELWQMLQYSASTYSNPSADSDEVGSLEKCALVRGIWLGNGWVQLMPAELGFAPALVQDIPVLARVKFQKRRQEGDCQDVGLYSIEDKELCAAAGAALGLGDWWVHQADGCFAISLEHSQSLAPLCSSLSPCHTTTVSVTSLSSTMTRVITSNTNTAMSMTNTSTTRTRSQTSITSTISTATTTSTSLHFYHPSLFCFQVFTHESYEAKLVLDQFQRKTNVFSCDQHMLISDAAQNISADDGRIETTTDVGPLACDRGDWGSWANALVFLEAWKAVIRDSRYERHDWTVKVDADCVFRPNRLKAHLIKFHGQEEFTQKVFYKNWMDEYPVIGAIEILSSAAVPDLASDACIGLAKDAGEDDWFVKCLRSSGTRMEEDDSLLQHQDRPLGNKCADRWWVAIHPFKDLNRYRWCEKQVEDSPPDGDARVQVVA